MRYYQPEFSIHFEQFPDYDSIYKVFSIFSILDIFSLVFMYFNYLSMEYYFIVLKVLSFLVYFSSNIQDLSFIKQVIISFFYLDTLSTNLINELGFLVCSLTVLLIFKLQGVIQMKLCFVDCSNHFHPLDLTTFPQ